VVTLVSRWLNADVLVFGQLVEVRQAATADAMLAEVLWQVAKLIVCRVIFC